MDAKKTQTDSVRRFVVANTFIGSLPADAVDTLMKAGQLRRYPKGTPLFERGDHADSLLLIMSGRVKISNITTDAREVVLNFLGSGDILGEIASLDGGARTASAMAHQDTQIFQLYRRDLLPVLTQHPAALLEIVQLLCERLRMISGLVEDSLRDMRGAFRRGYPASRHPAWSSYAARYRDRSRSQPARSRQLHGALTRKHQPSD